MPNNIPALRLRCPVPNSAPSPEPTLREVAPAHQSLREYAEHTESGVGGLSAAICRDIANLLDERDALLVRAEAAEKGTQRAVMDAIELAVVACGELRKLPLEAWTIDYAGILAKVTAPRASSKEPR